MKRWIINLCALAVVGIGGSSLLHATVPPVDDEYCCTGGGNKCCGQNGCDAGASGCSAW